MTRKFSPTFVLPVAFVAVSTMAAAGGGGLNNTSNSSGPDLPQKHEFPSLHLVAPLTLEVTREMQLADLGKDPTAAAALSKALKAGAMMAAPAPPPGSPWAKGIVVSPLSPVWPVGAAWGQAGVYMTSSNAFFEPWHPLPTPGKDYLTMVSVNDPSRSFFTLMFRWPKGGYYLISVNAVSEFPTAGRPRFGHDMLPSATLIAMSPDDPAKPTRWTALVNVPASEVSPGMTPYGFFPSNPAKVGGFIQAFVGKVTIRNL